MKITDKKQNIGNPEKLVGKTIVVKKFGYELRYVIKDVHYEKAFGSEVLDGIVTEVSSSECPYKVNDSFGITANELRVAKYLITSTSKS